MSLVKTYSPKSLWVCTLRLLNIIFRHPPAMSAKPVSYFQAVLDMHLFIAADLRGTLPNDCESESSNPTATVEQVYVALTALEKMLFCTTRQFAVTVQGCCCYTEYIERTLSHSKSQCRLL